MRPAFRNRTAMLRPLLLAAALLLSAPAWAEEVTGYDRFQLWNDCGPMKLVVEPLPQTAADIGLTREAITTAVRSRLRAAHLYDADAMPFLYVNVSVTGRAFQIGVDYGKLVIDLASGEYYQAATWATGSLGTHGGDSNYILSAVSQYTDKFIDEYLRVNEDACKR